MEDAFEVSFYLLVRYEEWKRHAPEPMIFSGTVRKSMESTVLPKARDYLRSTASMSSAASLMNVSFSNRPMVGMDRKDILIVLLSHH